MERTKINTDTWELLNLDERTAASLSLAHSKSTWEAGEIMSKAHFKYLEIQKRARKFLEIFTNHFEKYGGLFPENIAISFAFKEYLTLTVLERKHISRAVKQMEDPSYSVANKRNKLIVKEIKKLQADTSEPAKDIYNLIMDFDRWNNFRILPIEVQEPSAFKRRNKARNVKHLKKIISLPRYSVYIIIQKFSYSGKYKKVYLPLISIHLDDKYKVIDVKHKPASIVELTKAGLFLFDDRARADEFGHLVSGYFVDNIKNCKTGQRFWPEFRELVVQAVNYSELENIHKSRTYLDWATFDKDMVKGQRKKKENKDRVQDAKKFYPGVK